MAGLSDMEELLSHIQNKQTTDYMRESLACYNGAAYRACIVLSYIALFDDLRQKLTQLALINTTARNISNQIEERAEQQQVFESYMIDQLKATTLISDTDAFRLDQIRQLRNKAAHPSGMHASPEEARYVYFETIDKFLSRPVLKTTHAAEGILERLHNGNFFPSLGVDDLRTVVDSEMANIHHLATPYLITKLVDAVIDTDEAFSKNVRFILAGLGLKNDLAINAELQNRLLRKKADDKAYGGMLGTLVSGNPDLLRDLDSTTLLRVRGILEQLIASSDSKAPTQITYPANVLSRMLDRLGEEYVLLNFAHFAEQTTRIFCYSTQLVRGIIKSITLTKKLKEIWIENAGSTNFATANGFASAISTIDTLLLDFLHPADAFELIVQICRGAQWGAFEAIALRNARFSSTPKLKQLALKYAVEKPENAGEKAYGASLLDLPKFIGEYLSPTDPVESGEIS